MEPELEALHTSLVQSNSEEHENMINSGLRGGRGNVVLPISGPRRRSHIIPHSNKGMCEIKSIDLNNTASGN